MENQMDKAIDNDMRTGFLLQGLVEIRVSKN